MKPKKREDIIEESCKRLELDRNLVQDVIQFYWKKGVYEDIKNIEHFALHIPSVGSFQFIRKKIPILLSFFERKNEPEYLEKILRLKEKIEKEYERRNIHREKKKEFYKNLEEQVQDS